MKTNSKQKSALLVMLLSLLIPNIMAQEPKMPTLEDLIPGGATYRSAENISGLQWWGPMYQTGNRSSVHDKP